MTLNVIELNCPGCGARVSTEQKVCEWCHKPIIITSFNNIGGLSDLELNKYANAYKKTLAEHSDNAEINVSIGLCYLKLKLYDKAIDALEKAVEQNIDNSEVYFYLAVAFLRGKKAFVCSRDDIDKALKYLEAAITLEPKGIYLYYMAYIKYDYFSRKYLKTTPSYQECLNVAKQNSISENDSSFLFNLLGLSKPEKFY